VTSVVMVCPPRHRVGGFSSASTR